MTRKKQMKSGSVTKKYTLRVGVEDGSSERDEQHAYIESCKRQIKSRVKIRIMEAESKYCG